MKQRLVIKVGTNVLTNDHESLDMGVIAQIVSQIAELKKNDYDIILVSSGAVGAGKELYTVNSNDEIQQRQVYSSIGQARLMGIYADLFGKHGIICAQVLATKDDFMGKEHYKNMKNCFDGLLSNGIIPIVNENDVVSLKELMFTDNDELAGLTAFMAEVKTLILLSNIDGVFTGNPSDEHTELITEIPFGDTSFEQYIQTNTSSGGRGGMQSKFDTAKRLSEKGITVYIANGKQPTVILDIMSGKQVGTKFIATSS